MMLSPTSRIYEYAARATLSWHSLAHAPFRDFSYSLDRLVRVLGEDTSAEYWQPVVRHLRRYRFDVCAAPLPFDYQEKYIPVPVTPIEHQLAHCEQLYPSYALAAREVISSYRQLVSVGDNPMLDALDVLGHDPSQRPIALLLKESRLVPLAARELAARGLGACVEPVTVAQARVGVGLTTLVVAGSASWFPDDVFASPRAPALIVLYYEWIRVGWHPSTLLVGSATWQREASLPAPNRQTVCGPAPAPDEPMVGPEQILPPPLDLAGHHVHSGAADVDDATARLFSLQGGMGVYLDTDDGATILILDLEADGRGQLGRRSAALIEAGMCVLLRTAGGGDYIVPVADQILGDRAAHARACQELWKSRLRAVVRQQGLVAASDVLRDQGSGRANESNTRNWMSPRSIRTEDVVDFMAIMQLCGLEDRSQELWDVMGTIDTAHRKAGFAIARLLLQQVRSSDLRDLVRAGRMEFALPGTGTGSLTAYRVEEVAASTVHIAAARVGHPFSLEAW